MIGTVFNHAAYILSISTFCRLGHQLLARRAEIPELIDRGGGGRKGEVGERLGQHRIEKSRHADTDSDVRAEILADKFGKRSDVIDHRLVNVRFGRCCIERRRCGGLYRV
jgi:hypothetical protein